MRLARDIIEGEENWTMSVPCITSSWKVACISCLTELVSLYSLEGLSLLNSEEKYSTVNDM